MRKAAFLTLLLALLAVHRSSRADESAVAVTPSRVALDFVTTVFFDRKTDRIADFCHADAKHRMIPVEASVAAHLQKTISKLPPDADLRLKHLHVIRQSDISADFLKMVMPTVVEADMVASFKPFTDAMQEGFCCIAIFELVNGRRVRPYMFTFAFSPAGKSYKIALMDEGSPR